MGAANWLKPVIIIGFLGSGLVACAGKKSPASAEKQTTFVDKAGESPNLEGVYANTSLCSADETVNSTRGLPVSNLKVLSSGVATRVLVPACGDSEQKSFLRFPQVDVELPAWDLKVESWNQVDELTIINHTNCTSRTINLDRAIQVAEMLGDTSRVKRSSKLDQVAVTNEVGSRESEELTLSVAVRATAAEKAETHNLLELQYFSCSKWQEADGEKFCTEHKLLGRRLLNLSMGFQGSISRDNRIEPAASCN